MYRNIQTELNRWKEDPGRMPLILRGARQVGKTFTVLEFGKQNFSHVMMINFEKQPQYLDCFQSLQPNDILFKLNLMSQQDIVPGKTLLFLDEIQECPNALRALRYFKEDLPELHIIAAGSLLEFTLNDAEFRMPVGRVQFLYLYPLSFYEFLLAKGEIKAIDFLKNVKLNEPVPDVLHTHLLAQLREYMLLGGMPAVVKHYIDTQDILACQDRQAALWQTYRYDFGKYAKQSQHRYLETIFTKAPLLIGQHIKYTALDPESRSRDLKMALSLLSSAGLLHFVRETNASGLPLATQGEYKRFKLLFLDIGLIYRHFNIEAQTLLKEDLVLLNKGALAEQFVGQELIAASRPVIKEELYYWQRDYPRSSAEVDYIVSIGTQCVPLEVKAGKTGRLRSLQIFLREKQCKLGVQISTQNLHVSPPLLFLPLYLIPELPRLAAGML